MVGREHEISELLELYNHEKAELIAIYGRRRVGKTYLVDETFRERITFRHTGLSPIELTEISKGRPMRQQLKAFYYSLITQGVKFKIFKIKNFGKITEATIKLDGITVICGDNNTGKSTVGKALFSFYNALTDYKNKSNCSA